ncbi:MAG: radical SAM protein [Roseiflexaceae bacterium]
MRLTDLVEPVGDGRYRCGVCQWRCALGPGERGRCLVRAGDDAGIAVLNDGLISAAQVGPVEDHRLWHLLPGSQVLSLGGWGYAFPEDQLRGLYAKIPDDESKRRHLESDRAASFALEQLCRGIVWAYSDPSVAFEYVKEVLQLGRANSRYTALVSSGYMTTTVLDQLGPYLDGISLELRAFDDATYVRLTGLEHWRGILEITERARKHWSCHIEVTTRLHPHVNDTPEQIQALVGWIREALGPNTPWHVLPGDAGAAAAATVARARRLAHEAGLHFVYGPEPNQNTNCPSCGSMLIERGLSGSRVVGLESGRCASCGADLGIRMSIFKR